MCLHTVEGDSYIQITEYVVSDKTTTSGYAGRVFDRRNGIVGTSIKDGSPMRAQRRDGDIEAVINELVDTYNMTVEEAKKVSHDRKSWAAFPIKGGNGTVIAVLFADSNDAGLFDREEIQENLLAGCLGLCAFLRERYNEDAGIECHELKGVA